MERIAETYLRESRELVAHLERFAAKWPVEERSKVAESAAPAEVQEGEAIDERFDAVLDKFA